MVPFAFRTVLIQYGYCKSFPWPISKYFDVRRHISWHIIKKTESNTSPLYSWYSKTAIWSANVPSGIKRKAKSYMHTCDELLVWKWEIWISFQGDWGLLQGDYVSASKMHNFACFHATPSFFLSNLKQFAPPPPPPP